jgi:hypothetical protein
VAPVIVPALERKMADAAFLAEANQSEIWA